MAEDRTRPPRGVYVYERPEDHLPSQGKVERRGFYWGWTLRMAAGVAGPYPTESEAIKAAWKAVE